jgi:hypothetical protein
VIFREHLTSNEVKKVRKMLAAHPELANTVLDVKTKQGPLILACKKCYLEMARFSG